jgi:hypothetical protein
MSILLGYVSAEAGKEDNFEETFRNESLHEISNDKGMEK